MHLLSDDTPHQNQSVLYIISQQVLIMLIYSPDRFAHLLRKRLRLQFHGLNNDPIWNKQAKDRVGESVHKKSANN